MTERVEKEIELLRGAYPKLIVQDNGADIWVTIPDYTIPSDAWNKSSATVALMVNTGQYPAQSPYGIYVKDGIRLKDGGMPGSYSEPVETPLGGSWGRFSWTAEEWFSKADIHSGSNIINFVDGFAIRFKDGN